MGQWRPCHGQRTSCVVEPRGLRFPTPTLVGSATAVVFTTVWVGRGSGASRASCRCLPCNASLPPPPLRSRINRDSPNQTHGNLQPACSVRVEDRKIRYGHLPREHLCPKRCSDWMCGEALREAHLKVGDSHSARVVRSKELRLQVHVRPVLEGGGSCATSAMWPPVRQISSTRETPPPARTRSTDSDLAGPLWGGHALSLARRTCPHLGQAGGLPTHGSIKTSRKRCVGARINTLTFKLERKWSRSP